MKGPLYKHVKISPNNNINNYSNYCNQHTTHILYYGILSNYLGFISTGGEGRFCPAP